MLKFDPFDGALLVDKPAGPTSHDIVEIVRSQFGIAKVGHAGTLDPAATGLLILLLGRGTKLSETLQAGCAWARRPTVMTPTAKSPLRRPCPRWTRRC